MNRAVVVLLLLIANAIVSVRNDSARHPQARDIRPPQIHSAKSAPTPLPEALAHNSRATCFVVVDPVESTRRL